MGSRFLSGGGGDDSLLALTDGSFEINCKSATLQDLTPNVVLRANADKTLVSTLIEETDLNFSVISNPIASGDLTISNGNLIAEDIITDESPTGINSFITGTEMSIDDLQVGKVAKSGDTMTGVLTAPDIIIDDAPSLNTFVTNTESSLLSISTDKLNTDGSIIMTGNLQLGTNNITGVNDIQTQSISNTAGTLLIRPTGGQALFQKPGGGTIEFGLEDGGSQFNFKKNGATNELCSEGTDIIQFTTDCFGAVKIASLNPGTDAFQLRDYDLDMNSNEIQNVNLLKVDNIQSKNLVDDIVCGSNLDMFTKDVDNIGSMTITSTR